jgi:hypothetical protein
MPSSARKKSERSSSSVTSDEYCTLLKVSFFEKTLCLIAMKTTSARPRTTMTTIRPTGMPEEEEEEELVVVVVASVGVGGVEGTGEGGGRVEAESHSASVGPWHEPLAQPRGQGWKREEERV